MMKQQQTCAGFVMYPAMFLLGICFLSVGCSRSDDAIEPELNMKALDSLFSFFSPEYNYTTEPTMLLGHVARITTPGYPPWQGYYGVVDSIGSEDVNQNSMFRIGSATKVFTATIVLQLMEGGAIHLDTPFNIYLALDEVTYPKIIAFSGVTIRHLLSHRSGLPRISSTTFYEVHEYTDSISQLERMKFLFTEGEPEFAPGTEYAYRNTNFNILGLVIEAVTGSPYHKVLQDNICTRINLANTNLLNYDIQANDSRIAHGYNRNFDGTLFHGSQAWAAGGLVSTARDLSVFMEALVNGNLYTWPTTFQHMVTPGEGSSYGLGMVVQQTQQGVSYGHGGAIFGYNTRMEYFPVLNSIVISTMSFNGYDFVVVNWYDDFCFPVINEIRRAGNRLQ